MSLQLRLDGSPGAARAFLSGAIDESSGVAELLGQLQGPLTLNLAEIDRINSMGLVHWLRGIHQLTARHAVGIEAISYSLAVQAGNVVDLFGEARLLSCLTPYFCPSCRENLELEVRAEEVGDGGAAPARSCPRCERPLEFDEVDGFLRFLEEG